MTSAALFRRLFAYSLNYWPSFLVAVLGMSITAATETAFPALMKQLMDNGFQGVTSFSVWWVPIVVLGIFIVRGSATFVAHYSMEWLANNVLRDIRQALFAKLVTLPSSSFDKKSAGQLISKMISEAQQVLMAEYEKKRFATINTNFRGQAMRYAIAAGLQTPMSQFIAAIGVSVAVSIALLQTRDGTATPGDFVSFITAMLLMFSPLKHLAEVNSSLQRGLAAAEGVFDLLDESSETDTGTKSLGRATGQIRFSNVTVQYPDRDNLALSSVTLEIPAGQTYALVGPSGSGKSTFVNLLPRLYGVDSGSIALDGIDIHDLRLKNLRSQIALVSQDVVLFNDTIAQNIAYGRTDLTDAEIREAARAADLISFIDSLPQGMQTIVGDRGVRVSGGQRQRVAIARAIIKNAPILILDEATSALDTQSESNVQAAIEQLRKERTTIVVAHRLSTVLNADRIIVLEQGRVVQSGTHQELIRLPGLYQVLYEKMQDSAA